jgi:hypothetical protein
MLLPLSRAMAEVSRNRTDRSAGGGPTGFEVLGEHQPACTSVLILSRLFASVKRVSMKWWDSWWDRRNVSKKNENAKKLRPGKRSR